MAHKTLIGGTAYEITGGKTLVNGTAYSIAGGKTLVDGTAYGIGFVSWPDDLDTGLEFTSASAFSIKVRYNVGWNGTMEYCNGKGWKTWDGSKINSGETASGHCIYIRGIGNTTVTNGGGSSDGWTLTGTDIMCNGNIEKLLDYASVKAGLKVTMAEKCYAYMFYNCKTLITPPSLPSTTLTKECYTYMFYGCYALTKAPSLPATTMADKCYRYMFGNCRALTTAPSLPATTLAGQCYAYMFGNCVELVGIPRLPATTLATQCYQNMFYYCEKMMVSSTATDEYTKAYRVPYSGTGTTASNALSHMFDYTGGTLRGTPNINTTYYLHNSNTIV